jgi:DHA2 family multidrug resistance protein
MAEYFSWRWMFWTAAILTPLVMICIYFGVPRPPDTPKSEKRLSWRGFFYLSVSLSLIYGALDQGEHLDWLNSGVIVGFLAAGSFLLLVAVVRRFRLPNPMVNLPFLNARNIFILGGGVFFLRFALLATLVVIPGYLGNVQRYRALQSGHALAWVAVPEFLFVWLAAIVIVYTNSRLVLATGFGLIAMACWMCARIDSSWSGSNFVSLEVMLAAGIAAAFVGLVGSNILMAMELGALQNATNAATFSSCIHTVRLLGGQVGVALITHFLAVREQFHSNMLGLRVAAGTWITDERLRALAGTLTSASSGNEEAQARGLILLSDQVRAQAYTLASQDAFVLITWVVVCFLTTLLFLRRGAIEFGDIRKAR